MTDKKTEAAFKSKAVFNKVAKLFKSNRDVTASEVAEEFKISKSRAENILIVLKKRAKEKSELQSAKLASDIFAEATKQSFMRSSYR